MTFPPQCTTRADLHDHMARVLRMCKDVPQNQMLYPLSLDCVKYRGSTPPHYDGLPHLYMEDIDKYEFALAIVEGRPVFRGDVLYVTTATEPNGRVISSAVEYAGGWSLQWVQQGETLGLPLENWSWNPPQRTIEINGVKVKAPDVIIGEMSRSMEFHGLKYGWSNKADRDAAEEAFKAAMEGKK